MYYTQALLWALGILWQTRGSSCPQETCSLIGSEGPVQCTVRNPAMGIVWGALCSHGRTLNPIKCGGSSLDNTIAHLICRRQMRFHEANFILSQKARVHEEQRSWDGKEHMPSKEKQNIEQKWESCRRDWVERKVQFIMHLEMGLFLGTWGSHWMELSIKFILWKNPSGLIIDNGLERFKSRNQSRL